jgi:hypothetical protein
LVNIDGLQYLNVDTTTDQGIRRAHDMGFHTVPRVAHVIISPLIRSATEWLFTDEHKASMFTLIRHPVDRAVSHFYYLQTATWGKRLEQVFAIDL